MCNIFTQIQLQRAMANRICKLIGSSFSFFVHWGSINHLSVILLFCNYISRINEM